MISYRIGNILQADCEALVNPVNCVGVAGKGLALQFRQVFPANFEAYRAACQNRQLVPGKLFVFHTGLERPKYIINFPTKRHWRDKSRLEDIQLGLKSLIEEIRRLSVRSIAIPALGCGLGGLDWKDVRPMIEQAFQDVPEVHVMIYLPQRA